MTLKRSYNSEKRQAGAQKTREHILSAARDLFESQGFEKVTVEEIALKAEVSAPTIYSLYQSKSGVLKALIDSALPQMEYESIIKKMETEESIALRLELTARISRQIYDAEKEQLGLFRDVSILNPEFKKLEVEREERRFKRQQESFNKCKDKIFLGGLNTSKAKDVLWAFTGRDLYRMLVIERGWSSDEYEKWLAQLLVQLFLKPDKNEK